jgi:organic hydroperoxide reductase OsmC/OhrA
MKQLPHVYVSEASGRPHENLAVTAANAVTMEIAPPVEFDGPGDVWSPEELLAAAVASCLILSFRALAKASGLRWEVVHCRTECELDRVDNKLGFTRIVTDVTLTIPAAEDKEKAGGLLQKAEAICFITNSLAVASHFNRRVLLGNA